MEDEMGMSCNTHWGEEECLQEFYGRARKKKTIRKSLRVVGDNIKIDVREI
jgi:hypothetical protein